MTYVCQVDVLTVEIEHIDVDALESAASQFKLDVEPTPHTLRLIQVRQNCALFPIRAKKCIAQVAFFELIDSTAHRS